MRCRMPVYLLGGLAWIGVSLPYALGQQPLPPPKEIPPPTLEAPSPERVFRLESEASLYERMAREASEGKDPLAMRYKIEFPHYPPSPPPGILVRRWPSQAEVVEPAYVCYGRLYFEQINAERYGWDLGIIHPLVSAGKFFTDVALLPYHAGTDPLRCYECDTGYCLPGDPVPLLCYPPELSVTGALAEGAAIGLLFVMFP
jgi:hypothetical protein